jgi:hypothetical protein
MVPDNYDILSRELSFLGEKLGFISISQGSQWGHYTIITLSYAPPSERTTVSLFIINNSKTEKKCLYNGI